MTSCLPGVFHLGYLDVSFQLLEISQWLIHPWIRNWLLSMFGNFNLVSTAQEGQASLVMVLRSVLDFVDEQGNATETEIEDLQPQQ